MNIDRRQFSAPWPCRPYGGSIGTRQPAKLQYRPAEWHLRPKMYPGQIPAEDLFGKRSTDWACREVEERSKLGGVHKATPTSL